jgi:hypothetical protein
LNLTLLLELITEDFPKSSIKANPTKADESCVDLTCDSDDDVPPKPTKAKNGM